MHHSTKSRNVHFPSLLACSSYNVVCVCDVICWKTLPLKVSFVVGGVEMRSYNTARTELASIGQEGLSPLPATIACQLKLQHQLFFLLQMFGGKVLKSTQHAVMYREWVDSEIKGQVLSL